jgi:S1-C subfamily serine protease
MPCERRQVRLADVVSVCHDPARSIMTRKRFDALLAFCLSLAAVFWSASSAWAGSLQELAAKANPSVVLLTVSDSSGRMISTGTGFFVSPDGTLVTNHHVIEGAAKVTATLSDGRKVEALGVLAADEEKDLAILRVPGDGYPALALGDSHALRMGDEIIVIGSPLGLSGTLSTGIVSALRDEHALEADKAGKHSRAWGVQITAAVSPGSSGSPIMRPSGEVVAVAVGILVGGQGLNFGIPSEEVKALLQRAEGAKLAPFAPGGGSDIRKNLIISAAFFGAIALIYVALKRYDKHKIGAKKRVDRPSS